MIKILHIEDDDQDAKIISYLLQKLDLEIQIERCGNIPNEDKSFDVALLDLKLNAEPFEKTIHRFESRFPDKPFVILSNAAEEIDPPEHVATFAKEFDVLKLVGAIQHAAKIRGLTWLAESIRDCAKGLQCR